LVAGCGQTAADGEAGSALDAAPAHPVIFIHGHNGGASDGQPIFDALSDRFDGVTVVGTSDHQTWAANSIAPRRSLFSFDYYLKNGSDARGSFTAGSGRVGSAHGLCPDHGGYDQDFTHEFTADFAALVDDVLRATGASQVDIVTHSMGGLIARSYLTFYAGQSKIRNALLLASPNKGVALASLEGWIGSDPSWMGEHELTELDRYKLTSKSDFRICGEGGDSLTFPDALMKAELATTIVAGGGPIQHCMKGSLDRYIYDDSANYARCADYKVVDGIDHSGILKTPEAAAAAKAYLGI
jgi:pimeloyl-ACP methyl ester carboxylesterase